MLRMCVGMHSRFIENHPIWILEDGPLNPEVVLSHSWWLLHKYRASLANSILGLIIEVLKGGISSS
jgi:hypothetical protein